MNGKAFSTDPINSKIDALVSAIASGTAVVFVGAGISKAAELPDWAGLLSKCLSEAELHSLTAEDKELIRDLKKECEALRAKLNLDDNADEILTKAVDEVTIHLSDYPNISKLSICVESLKACKKAYALGLVKALESFLKRPWKWERTRRLFEEKNYLMVAELLHKGLGPQQLADYLRSEIGSQRIPSRLHRALARIPFGLAVTTNYDNLLEAAHPQATPVFTWQDSAPIFDAIRQDNLRTSQPLDRSRPHGYPVRRSSLEAQPGCPIIKAHGDLAKPETIVLTRTQYRDLEHQNEAFNECMKSLLAFRTFVFVGYSLTDPDILRQMDEVHMRYGKPARHYAIMPAKDVDATYAAFLRDSFGIETILYEPDRALRLLGKKPEQLEKRSSHDGGLMEKEEDKRTTAVFEVLKHLSGRAAAEIQSRSTTLIFGDPQFSRLEACRLLIRHACVVTGSKRGDICMIKTPNSRSLTRIATYPESPGQRNPTWDEIPHDSIVGWLFVQRNVGDDAIYIPDVAHTNEYLKAQSYAMAVPKTQEQETEKSAEKASELITAKYKVCDDSIRSELAVPIMADGECVGILNLESDIRDAYTENHMRVAKRFAEQAGAAYIAARRRKLAADGMRPCFETDRIADYANRGCAPLKALFDLDPYLNPDIEDHDQVRGMNFILWERDFDTGILAAHFDKSIFQLDEGGQRQASSEPTNIRASDDVVSNNDADHAVYKVEPLTNSEKINDTAPECFTYAFEQDEALAVSCYVERCRVAVDDASLDLKTFPSRLNKKGVNQFKIQGPVIAQPIRSRGHLSGVLVSWAKTGLKNASKAELSELRLRFSNAAERMHRITDVIANVPDLDVQRIVHDQGDYHCTSANLGEPTKELVRQLLKRGRASAFKRETLSEILRLLVGTCLEAPAGTVTVPFGRVRLWFIDAVEGNVGGDHPGWCVASESGSTFCADDRSASDAYLGVISPENDQFGAYTRHRAPTDPYARLQDPNMFGGSGDTNAGLLDKDPKGQWLVAPIVRAKGRGIESVSLLPKFELLGFISADCHKPIKSNKKGEQAFKDLVNAEKHEQLLRYQRRVLDLVTHLLADVLTPDGQNKDIWHGLVNKAKKAAKQRSAATNESRQLFGASSVSKKFLKKRNV